MESFNPKRLLPHVFPSLEGGLHLNHHTWSLFRLFHRCHGTHTRNRQRSGNTSYFLTFIYSTSTHWASPLRQSLDSEMNMTSRMSQLYQGTDTAFLIAVQWRLKEEGIGFNEGICIRDAWAASWEMSRCSTGGWAGGAKGEKSSRGLGI